MVSLRLAPREDCMYIGCMAALLAGPIGSDAATAEPAYFLSLGVGLVLAGVAARHFRRRP